MDKKFFPPMKWAQSKSNILVTIDIPDMKDPKFDVSQAKFKFTAAANEKLYEIDLELFDNINVQESKWNTKGRNIIVNLVKKEQQGEYWPRIMKEKVKNNMISIDWSKWVDEDDEQAKGGNQDMDFDPSGMQGFGGMEGMGGMPGMGGMGGQDSDDEQDSDEQEPSSKLADLDKQEQDDGKAPESTEEKQPAQEGKKEE